MDNSRNGLHISNMATHRPTTPPVPNYRLYRQRSGESGEFWIHCETIAERTHLHNWEINPHRHEALFQIFHLTAGEGELTGGSTVRRFAAPCAIYIPPGAVHGFNFSRAIDGLVLTAVADRLQAPSGSDRMIGAFLAEIRIVEFGEVAAEAALLGDAIGLVHRELASARQGHGLLLEATLIAALIALARADTAITTERSDAGLERMRRFETLLSAHFREQRPVSFYAARLGVSPAHLNRLTRRHFGRSVAAMIAQRVIETARRDLIFTPTPVQSIAYSLGFADPAYFNRFFRRHSGTTPGSFRDAERRRIAG
jgi:AraC family transcriptional regulator, transcriptional activator of pobA